MQIARSARLLPGNSLLRQSQNARGLARQFASQAKPERARLCPAIRFSGKARTRAALPDNSLLRQSQDAHGFARQFASSRGRMRCPGAGHTCLLVAPGVLTPAAEIGSNEEHCREVGTSTGHRRRHVPLMSVFADRAASNSGK
jgi:hypothetical protein